MHELSLCENIINIIKRQSKEQSFSKVVKISLLVGDMSGASPESLSFCFPLVAKNTIAENAILEIIECTGFDLKVKELEVG